MYLRVNDTFLNAYLRALEYL